MHNNVILKVIYRIYLGILHYYDLIFLSLFCFFFLGGYLYCTVGCHPTRCNEFVNYKNGPEGYLEEFRSLVKNNPSVVAIGECGLGIYKK